MGNLLYEASKHPAGFQKQQKALFSSCCNKVNPEASETVCRGTEPLQRSGSSEFPTVPAPGTAAEGNVRQSVSLGPSSPFKCFRPHYLSQQCETLLGLAGYRRLSPGSWSSHSGKPIQGFRNFCLKVLTAL